MNSMPEIIIRHVRHEDHDAWLEMVLDYDEDLGNRAEDAWGQLFNPELDHTGWVVVYDNVPCAFLNYTFHGFIFSSGKVCYLSDLYVKPEYRREGIARRLLTQLVELGQTLSWSRIYWITEFENPARGLYDDFGVAEFVRYHLDLFNKRH